ncbi:GNAT family N-acetyltransferase [Pelagibacteraceae bacterium]|nr:GNAT family N-acetyltransferase [Pelagibacteraceae bacterium]
MLVTNSSQSIKIRLAKLEDSKLLFKIYNAGVKDGYFNSENLINYKDHIAWFKKKINSNSKIYIGTNSRNKKFGYVRFDEVKNNIFEISLGNLPGYIGKGLGSLMLDKSIKKFKKNYKPKKIIASVKKLNVRSIKCFLKNNFVKVKFDKKKHFTINKIDTKKEYYFELKFLNVKKKNCF